MENEVINIDMFYNETSGGEEIQNQEVEVNDTDSEGITENVDATETEETTVDSDVVGDEVAEEHDDSEESEEELVYQIGDKEITLKKIEELEQGNLRQADYTKKTQALAEERKAIEAEKAQIAEKSKEIEALLSKLEKYDNNEEIDWDYLRETDTAEYLKQKELAESRKKDAEAAKQAIEAQRKADNDKRVAVEQQKLLELHPDWVKNGQLTEIGKTDFKLINDYVEEAGFSPEEFRDIQNHKVLDAILKAKKYEQLKSGNIQAKEKKRAPKVVKPSVKSTKQTQPKSAADVFYS